MESSNSHTGIGPSKSLEELEDRCKSVRRSLLEMIYRSKSSHIGTGLSMIEALIALYFRVLRVDSSKPLMPERDKFVLSKAHGSAALYATLAERGFFEKDLLKGYYVDGGTLPGHLDRCAVPGVETSGGSLGHGLSLGLGLALADKIDQRDSRTFVLLGDGECNEGSVWEAIMLAPHLRLNNLCAVIDFNGIQSLGFTNEIINQANLADRLSSFGWDVESIDGHDLKQVVESLDRQSDRPRALVLNTVKGKGISFMENKLLWHYRSPSEDEFKTALEELRG